MRAPLSIVIPTRNAADALPASLAALVEGLEAGLIRELIVSDGGSEDATREIAEGAGAEVISGAAGRGGQLARGCAVAAGDWLLVLHSDTRLMPGWSAAALRAMESGAPHAFRLRFGAKGTAPRLVAGWANLRSRVFHMPFGDQGLLVPRAVYEAAGGYADVPLMEDMGLARALNKNGGPIRLMDHAAQTSWARYEGRALRQGATNLWRQVRFLAGAAPDTLAKRYD